MLKNASENHIGVAPTINYHLASLLATLSLDGKDMSPTLIILRFLFGESTPHYPQKKNHEKVGNH